MEYTLHDDFPAPLKHPRARYPFKKMEVGQHFVIETELAAHNARCAARDYAKRNPGWEYTCRKNNNGGWNFWRIA